MKRFLLLFWIAWVAVSVYGQTFVTGRVLDRDTKEGLMQATVQLLNAGDSTFAAGAVSDESGQFVLKPPKDGHYIVRITSVGYKQYARKLTVAGSKELALGDITLGAEAIMLKGTTISGQARRGCVKIGTSSFFCTKPRLSQARALLFPKVFVTLGIQ